MRTPCILHLTTVPQTLHFLSGHIQHAKSKGFEVHALSSPGESLDQFGRDMQIEVHSVVMTRRITPLSDLRALLRIARIMRRIRPAIVDGHTPKGALLAMMAATLCLVPVRVYHLHGLPMVTAKGLQQRLLSWTEWIACKLSHQVISMSDSLRELAIAEGLCPAEKIKVLNHGSVDGVEAYGRFDPTGIPAEMAPLLRDRYQIPRDAHVVGFVGRIVRDKGLVELGQSWQALREEFASLHLLIAGPFESQDPIPADLEEMLRKDPRIHLAGEVTDVPSIYHILDLLVLPTYREGLGTVLLEAAAMEVPVVATRIPGCLDAVLAGETGTLVPPHDAEALTSSVRTYLRDPDLRRRHGAGGRQRVLRDFDPEAVREALFQEYVRLLGGRPWATAFLEKT
jgi:glycosyltransferase involved in cell wall biosynthesis